MCLMVFTESMVRKDKFVCKYAARVLPGFCLGNSFSEWDEVLRANA